MTAMQDLTGAQGATGRFGVATTVQRQGPGEYLADLDAEMSVAGKLNGGYLLAVLVRAVLAELAEAEPDSGAAAIGGMLPVASTAHYLGAARPGPAQLAVEVLRRGSSTGQVRARLQQEGETSVDAVVTVARVREVAGWSDGPVVELPPEQSCFLMPTQAPGAPFETPIMGLIEERLDPSCLAFAFGQPTGAGQLRGWLRITGADPTDPAALILAADALPPAAFDLGHLGWVPTLSLTVHLTGLPAPGPLRVRQQVRGLESGVLTQVCDIWDDAGRLVAHAVQLAALPPDRHRR
jgi:acyl-coenzyme A thioesterase PaaI-like protein